MYHATMQERAADYWRQFNSEAAEDGLWPGRACPVTQRLAATQAEIHDEAIFYAALAGGTVAADALDEALRETMSRREWGLDGLASYYDARREPQLIWKDAAEARAALAAIQEFARAARRRTERGAA